MNKMNEKIKLFIQNDGKYALSSFLIPLLIMFSIYYSLGIYWGSEITVLASDAFSQFSNFHASFNNMLHGDQSLFYTWNASLGLNYYALVSYYLGGIFTPIVLFFKNQNMPDALYLITLLKIGSAGLSFWIYAKNTFKISRWGHVALSVSYALMSFVTAHSELIMWFDTFLYLPLIILGINRLMDKNKPLCLFISYLLLFISNFYMGFMVGIFSLLYYIACLVCQFKLYKKSIVPYLVTSISAGIASMIMILPAVLDLRSNGESLTKITQLKTEATSFWDIVIKNMLGSFDTTKYGSIPFIYVGLFPLILCVYYFVTKKIPLKNKLAFGSIFAIVIASFYFVPLNLFWQGMHAPNMFLFRYSFVFSFLVIMLAGYSWEKFTKGDLGYFVGTAVATIGVFCLAASFMTKNRFAFVENKQFYLTLVFLFLYLLIVAFYQLNHLSNGRLTLILLVLMSTEAALNTNYMLNGVKTDWNYPSRSLYAAPYEPYKKIVDEADKLNKNEFYRLESLDPISSNDGINYGFSGISFFSSIRNRNSSDLMDQLGFRSRDANLNIRYPNNTLLMDAFTGIRHNIAIGDPLKYGFSEVATSQEYKLYKNENALPLGMLTDNSIYKVKLPKNDNLGSQTNLYNQLAGTNLDYFTFTTPTMVGTNNTKVLENDDHSVTYTEEQDNISKTVTWTANIPAGKQAYLSLYPTNFSELESSSATVTINGNSFKHQINITGQYYNLGYYDQHTSITFSASFYGTTQVSFMKPLVMLMDIPKFEESTTKIKEQGVPFTVTGRKATATVEATKDQVILTTIPYDKGWAAYVDGKAVPIKAFKDALITVPVQKGKHKVELVFLPQGFKMGVLCFIGGIALFSLYLNRNKWWVVERRKQKQSRSNGTKKR